MITTKNFVLEYQNAHIKIVIAIFLCRMKNILHLIFFRSNFSNTFYFVLSSNFWCERTQHEIWFFHRLTIQKTNRRKRKLFSNSLTYFAAWKQQFLCKLLGKKKKKTFIKIHCRMSLCLIKHAENNFFFILN